MKNIFYCSFGKDSIAQILLAYENGIKVDYIVFVEVMATKTISGEHPLHIKWVKDVAIPKLNKMGYEVTILHSDKTYEDLFFHTITRSKNLERNGKIQGFALGGRCVANRDLKMKPIKKFNDEHKSATQYVGIAIDEQNRLEKLKGNKKSLLAQFNYTEKDARLLCEKYDLLSPIYDFSCRNGCWFCPNAKMEERAYIYNNYKDYWDILNEWDKSTNKISKTFCYNKSLGDINKEIEKFNNKLTIFDLLDK